jgi:hypothetical protein
VFDDNVLRSLFGPNRNEVTREWRRLHDELNDLYSTRNIFWVIKSRRIRWEDMKLVWGSVEIYVYIKSFGGEI